MQPSAASVEPGDHEAIRQIVKNINQAWLNDRFEELDQYLHPDVIFVLPRFSGRLEGRAACIESYRDFCAQAKVREYRDGEPLVDVFSATAIATYPFHMLYELADESYREDGFDTLVFAKGDGGWRAVWRSLSITPGVA